MSSLPQQAGWEIKMSFVTNKKSNQENYLSINFFKPLKHSIKLCLTGGGGVSVLIGLLLWHVASPSGRGQIFKHGGVMGGEHVLQVWRHGVGPEEVMIERIVAVYALCGVQDEEFIYQIQGVRVFDIGFETILHFPLLAFRQLHFLVKLILLVHARPHLIERENGSEFSWQIRQVCH